MDRFVGQGAFLVVRVGEGGVTPFIPEMKDSVY